ncbi:type II toxin-antitoxin system PemK/MazF family toxin [Rhizobium sp. S152]|uniref:type II toxin-antitoxin system PemK/MazF family toxin n=1 Tax=Rhizobium sp. S152 TaxID=3055038 RepID=UPI0025A9F89C|nr:type II toxin-antitoxin system PemK/MazF family toxin [Rhizobium sp. S152]MDM9629644.1 type II toxin-antitoxin system PemK/MazF family toxin [Rhizobium sp. S152]
MANLDPILGSEQAGIRPVIILSADSMNLRSRRVIVCPITSNIQPWTTKIALPDGLKTRGMVLADQVRSIDKAARLLRFIEPMPADFVMLVRSYVGRLLDLEVAGAGG